MSPTDGMRPGRPTEPILEHGRPMTLRLFRPVVNRPIPLRALATKTVGGGRAARLVSVAPLVSSKTIDQRVRDRVRDGLKRLEARSSAKYPLQTTFQANSLHPHKAGYLQGFLRAERRRSRTYPAVGYTTSPVLKTGWGTGPMPLHG